MSVPRPLAESVQPPNNQSSTVSLTQLSLSCINMCNTKAAATSWLLCVQIFRDAINEQQKNSMKQNNSDDRAICANTTENHSCKVEAPRSPWTWNTFKSLTLMLTASRRSPSTDKSFETHRNSNTATTILTFQIDIFNRKTLRIFFGNNFEFVFRRFTNLLQRELY